MTSTIRTSRPQLDAKPPATSRRTIAGYYAHHVAGLHLAWRARSLSVHLAPDGGPTIDRPGLLARRMVEPFSSALRLCRWRIVGKRAARRAPRYGCCDDRRPDP